MRLLLKIFDKNFINLFKIFKIDGITFFDLNGIKESIVPIYFYEEIKERWFVAKSFKMKIKYKTKTSITKSIFFLKILFILVRNMGHSVTLGTHNSL